MMASSISTANGAPKHQNGTFQVPSSDFSDRFFDALEDISVQARYTVSNSTSSDGAREDIFDEPSPSRNVASRLESFRALHAVEDTPATSDVEIERGQTTPREGGNPRIQPVQEGLDEITELSVRPQQVRTLECIRGDQFTYPKSKYEGNDSGPIYRERDAIYDLLEALRRKRVADLERAKQGLLPNTSPADFSEFELMEFSIYLPEHSKLYASQLRGLQNLGTKNGHSMLLFDGYLCAGGSKRYVQGVPFQICCIGNYGQDMHSVGDDIWIQSAHNPKSKLYYRLKEPASEYARYHSGFAWLADLAKHFVDYCQSIGPKPVSIHNFRVDFSQWLQRTHGESSEFQLWYQQFQHEDFRTAIVANANFLYKESVGVDSDLRDLLIWKEILEKDAFPENPIQETKTIVTPYVYECFNHLKFGHHLKVVEPITMAQSRRFSQGLALHLTVDDTLCRPSAESLASKFQNSVHSSSRPRKRSSVSALSILSSEAVRRQRIEGIKVGDVVAVTKDGDGSVWKDEISRWKAADDAWYILVQGIHTSNNNERSFDALWLYRPSDTSCAKMKYPFPNELFLSDNCTCSKSRILQNEVLDVVSVAWNGDLNSAEQFFIRQTYLENEKFVTLRDSHKKCEHFHERENPSPRVPVRKYAVGQTVLVRSPRRKGKLLEPYELVGYLKDGLREFVFLRHLLRRVDLDGKGRPNELVYSEEIDKFPVDKIDRPCLVRFYSEADAEARSIPAPYSRDGTANAFYISTRLIEANGDAKLVSIMDDLPESLIQGFNPDERLSREVLRGMDLYCGGGNFGRGLEEGGAMHNVLAVDIMKTAIHTYYANLKDPKATNLYHGSVDDLLYKALQGNPKNSPLVPLPGDIDFISAGSPCQGFSALNPDKNNDKGLKNQSLVASVAAYVDFYRPKYGLLENVMNMAQKGRGRDEDVLSQLICSLVGMGYQLQLFVLDAWSFGSPQSRSRLFVSFSAPGCEPLEHPDLSHSHPKHVADRGLGKLANGQSFGQRLHPRTPFEYVGAGEATKDLPNIGDGATYHCVPFPDHIMSHGLSARLKLQMAAIPMHPRGMNFVKAWNEGKGPMTKEEREFFPTVARNGKLRQSVSQISRAWGRVNPQGLFGTVVVSTSPADSRMGNCLHWEQQRVLTVMEMRRAQGFLDEDVLVGIPAEQLKMVGNSVARTVSLALGLSLREAWLRNPPDVEFDRNVWAAKNTAASKSSVAADRTIRSQAVPQIAKSITRTPLRCTRKTSIQIVIPSVGSRHLATSLLTQTSQNEEKVLSNKVEKSTMKNISGFVTKSLKRTYGTMQGSAPSRSQKPKFSNLSTSQPSSSRSNQVSPNAVTKNNSNSSKAAKQSAPSYEEMAQKLRNAKELLLQNPDYFADDDDDDDSEDELLLAKFQIKHYDGRNEDDRGPVVSTSPTSFATPAHRNRFESRKIVTPKTGMAKSPSRRKMLSVGEAMESDKITSKPTRISNCSMSGITKVASSGKIHSKSKKKRRSSHIIIKTEPGIIDLVSDDDEPFLLAVRRTPQWPVMKSERPILSPPTDYVSVNNNMFSAYAQTNKFIQADRNRKVGSRSG